MPAPKAQKKSKKPAPAEPELPPPTNGKGKTAKTDGTATPPVVAEAEKRRLDTRTLIAGASWTGKLPQTLFNEHVQKQATWQKPDYSVRQTPDGFTGAVTLRRKDPKTQEVTVLPPIMPPRPYMEEKGAQPSAVEARHFAATYALFRVCNMKNMAMALPPQYRDLWKGDFEQLKKEAVAQGNGYLYEADPFQAVKHRDDNRRTKEKERAEREKKREAEVKQAQVSVSMDGQVRKLDKGWSKAPKVEMGVKTRRDVEFMVRSQGVWNPYGVQLDGGHKKKIREKLTKYGFRPSHVEEAMEMCGSQEECIEWLLIHLPEDDVPAWALPENYLAGLALGASDLAREGKIKRLCAAGYSRDVCVEVLDGCGGSEAQAAFGLQSRLLGIASQDLRSDNAEDSHGNELWQEEQATLEAIFIDRYSIRKSICSVELEVRTPNKSMITVRARPSKDYPRSLPAVSVETSLPAYIKLSILRQALVHAQQNLLGEIMLFNILDWLEQEIPRIIEQPDPLRTIANATSVAVDTSVKPTTARSRPKRHPRPIVWSAHTPTSKRIQQDWTNKQKSADQMKMLKVRQNLPAWKLRDRIVASVSVNQVTIISGETGSGKSTQSVQFVLDDLIGQGYGEHANIICTQPRRISAIGLADRVADERCGRVGDEVGYTIRGESKQKAGTTKITFVTTGVLLRRLQTSGGSAQDVVDSLADVSHVVIDEVHERSLDTDFLLVLIRNVLKMRKDLKLILMSATLDAQVFERYFSGVSSVGKVEIEGRTHPVNDIYRTQLVNMLGYGFGIGEDDDDASEPDSGIPDDWSMAGNRSAPRKEKPRKQYTQIGHDGHNIDYDMICQVVQHIDRELGGEEGGILIFLPGTMEIDRTIRALGSVQNLHALPLHAGLQSAEQRRVFAKPPRGLRKVVAATNVAETSITIDDIVAVIDTGRVKETSFDPANNMVRLTETWASRAACKQRRGRAGRVRAGKCYKLYTENQESKMAERPEPEIRRVPLEQLCLSVKAMGVTNVPAFLASALTPPESLSVSGALDLLGRVGALDQNELTALGRHMSMIPADLRCSKLMVYGAAFGCLDACLTIAATLTVKSPFVAPQAKRDEAKASKASFGGGNGDLLCDLRAFEQWSERRSQGEPTSMLRRWCDGNFLNNQTLFDIASTRSQYVSSLQEIGFVPHGRTPETYNRNNQNEGLLRSLIAGAFQPQLARIDFPDAKYKASAAGAVAINPEAHTIKYFSQENGRVFVHPSSTIFDAQGFPGNSAFMSFFAKMATSKIFIRDLTPCNVYSLLMFGGKIEIDEQGRGLLVDGWLRLKGWARIGVLVSRMRMMLDEVLARKVDEPGLEMSETEIVKLVSRMVAFDGLDR
ncbi:putative ATP-dependent RNA helicase ucp12 [Recurvomyces mirabilis]|uniref:RNA helicase n=1 Tax=Recurvomyces mirabilis TaxID=574656 RepID=A0AAE1C6J1_9PEZI|nr:putative ATP-dependent RNA helicase ucp12 [Recurvomyces mirabilis]KAK5162076.1 putative ATP-dependent RNA helicase ucp12 [Recurvomyces mirabilis]